MNKLDKFSFWAVIILGVVTLLLVPFMMLVDNDPVMGGFASGMVALFIIIPLTIFTWTISMIVNIIMYLRTKESFLFKRIIVVSLVSLSIILFVASLTNTPIWYLPLIIFSFLSRLI